MIRIIAVALALTLASNMVFAGGSTSIYKSGYSGYNHSNPKSKR